jgi:hypothetical protein
MDPVRAVVRIVRAVVRVVRAVVRVARAMVEAAAVARATRVVGLRGAMPRVSQKCL